jgi:phosphohistidine phosphatase
MQELYLIRHGLAGKRLEDETKDKERSLKKKGKEQMKDIAKGLKELKVSFDIILTSPLVRANESAVIVNEYCGNGEEVTITKFLKPDASYNNLIKFLNSLKEYEKIAIVGHEPFLSGFASHCLSKSKTALMNLKKGGALMLEIDKTIKPGRCILSWLMEPKHLIAQEK